MKLPWAGYSFQPANAGFAQGGYTHRKATDVHNVMALLPTKSYNSCCLCAMFLACRDAGSVLKRDAYGRAGMVEVGGIGLKRDGTVEVG